MDAGFLFVEFISLETVNGNKKRLLFQNCFIENNLDLFIEQIGIYYVEGYAFLLPPGLLFMSDKIIFCNYQM